MLFARVKSVALELSNTLIEILNNSELLVG